MFSASYTNNSPKPTSGVLECAEHSCGIETQAYPFLVFRARSIFLFAQASYMKATEQGEVLAAKMCGTRLHVLLENPTRMDGGGRDFPHTRHADEE